MPELEKSDVFKNLLDTMIKISGRKTNKGHAISIMDSLIKQLEPKFDFLRTCGYLLVSRVGISL